MRAVVVSGPGRASVETLPDPSPDGRALVAVHQAGVCGTDIKILEGGAPVQYPRILGHELVGVVVRAGSRGLIAEGTRVLIDPTIACGVCAQCRMDNAHLCPSGGLMGRDVDGGFADFVAVDEAQLHPLPDEISDRAATLVQVLGTCVHGQRLVTAFPGETAAVIGLGVTGLLHLQLLLARGFQTVVGITRSPEKRALALRLGASAAAAPEDAEEAVAAATRGAGADLVVESAGQVATLAQAIRLTRLGAPVLQFGTISASEGALPFYELYRKEIALISARGARPRDYTRAIDLTAAGRVRLEPLLSARYPLEAAAEALNAFARNSGLLKVTLDVDDDGQTRNLDAS